MRSRAFLISLLIPISFPKLMPVIRAVVAFLGLLPPVFGLLRSFVFGLLYFGLSFFAAE